MDYKESIIGGDMGYNLGFGQNVYPEQFGSCKVIVQLAEAIYLVVDDVGNTHIYSTQTNSILKANTTFLGE